MSEDVPIRTGNQRFIVMVATILALSPVALVTGFSPSSSRPMVTPGPLSYTVAITPASVHPAPVRSTPRVQPGPVPGRP